MVHVFISKISVVNYLNFSTRSPLKAAPSSLGQNYNIKVKSDSSLLNCLRQSSYFSVFHESDEVLFLRFHL